MTITEWCIKNTDTYELNNGYFKYSVAHVSTITPSHNPSTFLASCYPQHLTTPQPSQPHTTLNITPPLNLPSLIPPSTSHHPSTFLASYHPQHHTIPQTSHRFTYVTEHHLYSHQKPHMNAKCWNLQMKTTTHPRLLSLPDITHAATISACQRWISCSKHGTTPLGCREVCCSTTILNEGERVTLNVCRSRARMSLASICCWCSGEGSQTLN